MELEKNSSQVKKDQKASINQQASKQDGKVSEVKLNKKTGGQKPPGPCLV